MLNLELSWQEAAVVSGCLLAAGAVAQRAKVSRLPLAGTAMMAREAGILFGLFALWQFAGSFSVMPPDQALGRAAWIWHTERLLHMPSETLLQRLFLPHPLLVEACNLYYASLHFMVLIAFLIWLYARHRDQYRRARMTVVLFTAGSLLVQLIPVAPPRMLPGDGLIDTAVRYGQSVYGSVAGFNADQLSAMPSVHIGWALLIAVVVICVSRSRWRWAVLAYPGLTTVVVVVTANHFWLDGAAAAALLALVLVLQRALRLVRRPVRAQVRRLSMSRAAPRREETAAAPLLATVQGQPALDGSQPVPALDGSQPVPGGRVATGPPPDVRANGHGAVPGNGQEMRRKDEPSPEAGLHR